MTTINTTVPANFLRHSFRTWIDGGNVFRDSTFYFDESRNYIEFSCIYQYYDQNMSIRFGGTEVKDLIEIFRQLDEMKTEMLDEFKTHATASINSLSLSYNFLNAKLKQRRGWIYCQHPIGIGGNLDILRFGEMEMYAQIIHVHDDNKKTTHMHATSYPFHTEEDGQTLERIVQHVKATSECKHEIRQICFETKAIDDVTLLSVPLWKLTFPTYRVGIIIEVGDK